MSMSSTANASLPSPPLLTSFPHFYHHYKNDYPHSTTPAQCQQRLYNTYLVYQHLTVVHECSSPPSLLYCNSLQRHILHASTTWNTTQRTYVLAVDVNEPATPELTSCTFECIQSAKLDAETTVKYFLLCLVDSSSTMTFLRVYNSIYSQYSTEALRKSVLSSQPLPTNGTPSRRQRRRSSHTQQRQSDNPDVSDADIADDSILIESDEDSSTMDAGKVRKIQAARRRRADQDAAGDGG